MSAGELGGSILMRGKIINKFEYQNNLRQIYPRLELCDETTRSLPNELKIEYERFAKLMPLPTFQTKDEIERQIAGLIKPLKNAGYIKSFSNEYNLNEMKNFLLFRFGE